MRVVSIIAVEKLFEWYSPEDFRVNAGRGSNRVRPIAAIESCIVKNFGPSAKPVILNACQWHILMRRSGEDIGLNIQIVELFVEKNVDILNWGQALEQLRCPCVGKSAGHVLYNLHLRCSSQDRFRGSRGPFQILY